MGAKGGRPRATDPAQSISISLPASLLAAIDSAAPGRSAWVRQAIEFSMGIGDRPPRPSDAVVASLRPPERRREVTPMWKKGMSHG